MTTLSVHIDAASGNAVLTLPTGGAKPLDLKMDTQAVESLLTNFGECRRNMRPPVPRDFPPMMVQAHSDPSWLAQSQALTGLPVLSLRDPRYGWLHYSFQKAQARKLGEALIVFRKFQIKRLKNGASGTACTIGLCVHWVDWASVHSRHFCLVTARRSLRCGLFCVLRANLA